MTLVKITTISYLVTTNKMSRWIVQPNKNCTSRLFLFKRRMAISHETLIYYFIVAKTIIPVYTTFSTKPFEYRI